MIKMYCIVVDNILLRDLSLRGILVYYKTVRASFEMTIIEEKQKNWLIIRGKKLLLSLFDYEFVHHSWFNHDHL